MAVTGEDRRRRATIHDVARHASVSAATVSKVLSGVKSVRAENAERVRASVKALGYRMDPLAAGLRHDQRRIIAAVVPDLESAFFGALVSGLERAAESAGYHMIVSSSRESEERETELIARMNDWRVAGTVLVPVRSERGTGAARLRELGMTAVLVDRVSASEHFDTVTADNHGASAAVADFLLEKGHRHVLLHGATRISKAVRTRHAGFCERVRQRAADVRIETLLSDENVETQRREIRTYFDTREGAGRPTAIFSLSQNSTLLVLSELRRRGIRCPDDIALIGFDNADWMQMTWPSITTVAQPVDTIAQRALGALLARVEGKVTGLPVQHSEPCKMLVRQSSGPRQETSLTAGRDE